MTFRNRKITDAHAIEIAAAITHSRYMSDLDAARDALEKATDDAKEFSQALAHTMPARDSWLALSEDHQRAVHDRSHIFHWQDKPSVHVEHEVSNFQHSIALEDFKVLQRGGAEGTLSYFVDDWQKWDFHGQMSAAIKTTAWFAAYIVACEAEQSASSDYEKVQHGLFREMRDRSTKDVIAAWPEAERFIHQHYDYLVTSSPASSITTPIDTVITNALTPAITMAAE